MGKNKFLWSSFIFAGLLVGSGGLWEENALAETPSIKLPNIETKKGPTQAPGVANKSKQPGEGSGQLPQGRFVPPLKGIGKDTPPTAPTPAHLRVREFASRVLVLSRQLMEASTDFENAYKLFITNPKDEEKKAQMNKAAQDTAVIIGHFELWVNRLSRELVNSVPAQADQIEQILQERQ